MVFLRGGGGEGTRARRVREAAVPCRQGSRRVVRDHEPRVDTGSWAEEGGQALGAPWVQHAVYPTLGDGSYLRSGDGQEVEDERERLPMEVASALHPPVGQHHGVVRDGVELAGSYPP